MSKSSVKKNERKKETLEFSRYELRFFVDQASLPSILRALKGEFEIESVGDPSSDSCVIQTFYFGQSSFMPENILMKLRKYTQRTSGKRIQLHPRDICILEVKSSPESKHQWKERETVEACVLLESLSNPTQIFYSLELGRGSKKQNNYIKLETVQSFLSEIDSEKSLELLLAIECVRRHLVPKDSAGVRLTFDSDQKYYGFLGGTTGELMGQEQRVKVECKYNESASLGLLDFVQTTLKYFQAVPIDSRKQYVQNLYLDFSRRKKKEKK